MATTTRSAGQATRLRSMTTTPATLVRAPTWHELAEEERVLLSQLLAGSVEYVDHPIFRRRDAEQCLFGDEDNTGIGAPMAESAPASAWIGPRARLLAADEEVKLFQQFNYARYRQYLILKEHRNKRLNIEGVRQLLVWRRKALEVREQIVAANRALVLAMAKRTRWTGVDFDELVSEGNMALLRSVSRFDCSFGCKLSTYAYYAVARSFSRLAMRKSRHQRTFPTSFDPSLQKSDWLEQKRRTAEAERAGELRSILTTNAAALSDIEQVVIAARFPLPPNDSKTARKTLKEVGALIGVSKERARNIQNKALQKLRAAFERGTLAASRGPHERQEYGTRVTRADFQGWRLAASAIEQGVTRRARHANFIYGM